MKVGQDLSDFPLQTRESLLSERVRQTLYKYGRFDGITAALCSKITGITEPTARRHLEKLCLIREAYSTKIGKTTLYFPNGEPLHGFGKYRFEDKLPHILEAVLSSGPRGRMLIHITEKRYSVLDGEKVEGGIIVPMEYADKLAQALKSLKEKGEQIEQK